MGASFYRLRYWNATAIFFAALVKSLELQQYLPFTVLKPTSVVFLMFKLLKRLQQYLPFTVLKPVTLITNVSLDADLLQQYLPFTVLKLCREHPLLCWYIHQLQQYLPFTVLKHYSIKVFVLSFRSCNSTNHLRYMISGWVLLKRIFIILMV